VLNDRRLKFTATACYLSILRSVPLNQVLPSCFPLGNPLYSEGLLLPALVESKT